MMVRPTRNEQFVANEVCIVHTVQRCVRKAFLAGVDEKFPASITRSGASGFGDGWNRWLRSLA